MIGAKSHSPSSPALSALVVIEEEFPLHVIAYNRASSTDLFIDIFDEVCLVDRPFGLVNPRRTAWSSSRSCHVREVDNDPVAPPPSFEDFRGTIEPLDHRLKSSVQQTVDIVGELRRFRQSGERLNRSHSLT